MITQLCVLLDTAAEVYGQLGQYQSTGAAVRAFQDGVKRVAEDNVLNKHPEHFHLYHIGSYDDSTARVTMLDAPRLLMSGVDVAQ